ncbi:fibronectin type III domain-containing protein [Candidatus Bipolaricaulota bacterium]
MLTKRCSLRAATLLGSVFLFLLATLPAAGDWRDAVEPGLAALITPDADGDRLVVVALDPSSAPDAEMLDAAYSYVARSVWTSSFMKLCCEQLAGCCDLVSGWALQRSGHRIWEATSAYVAFAHALVVRCPLRDIPQIAALPFVAGIYDGESEVPILRSTPDSYRVPDTGGLLLAWADGIVDASEINTHVASLGWLPIFGASMVEIRRSPYSSVALSTGPMASLEESVALRGVGVSAVSPSSHDESALTPPWPYDIPVASLASVPALTKAELLLCIDAALHAGASYITLCAVSGTHEDAPSQTAALLWTESDAVAVASARDVEGAATATSLPPDSFPVPITFATKGSHEDRVVVEWEQLDESVTYEVLRALPGQDIFASIALEIETRFSDYDVERCVQYKYVVRALCESGVGLEPESVSGFVGEIPKTIEWITAEYGWEGRGGIQVEWAPVQEALNYRLWRCEPIHVNEQWSSKVYLMCYGPETSFLDLDVVPGITYRYTAIPVNSCGSTPLGNPTTESAAVFLMPPEGRPRPPEWVTATLVDPIDRVQVAWVAVAGVDTYNVHRATAYGGPYEIVHTTSELTWDDTDSEHCQDYWYRIQSVAGEDSGPLSSVAHGVCGGKPGLPAGVVASDRTYADAIRLDWQPGREADFYRVFRATSPDGLYIRIATTEELYYVDSGLEPGQRFWYRVVSRNACGGSGYSDPVGGATVY